MYIYICMEVYHHSILVLQRGRCSTDIMCFTLIIYRNLLNRFEDKLLPSAGEADETWHQTYQRNITDNSNLGGGNSHICLIFTTNLGKDSYFDLSIFFKGVCGFNHQLQVEMLLSTSKTGRRASPWWNYPPMFGDFEAFPRTHTMPWMVYLLTWMVDFDGKYR